MPPIASPLTTMLLEKSTEVKLARRMPLVERKVRAVGEEEREEGGVGWWARSRNPRRLSSRNNMLANMI